MKKIPFVFRVLLVLLALNPAYADEVADRAAIRNESLAAFQGEDFPKLESMAEAYRNSRTRTDSGLWKLTLFYSGLQSSFSTRTTATPFWEKAEKSVEKWIAAFPNSKTARLAYARMLLNRGWSIRGHGYAGSVSPGDWAPFKEKVQQARAYLEKHKGIAGSDPYWYEMMAEIAILQDWPEQKFEALVAEGLALEPHFYQIYFKAIDYYTPKWGGSATSIEKFAQSAVKKTMGTEGFGMYARVYWYASQAEYGSTLFSQSDVQWSAMKKGIDDVLKKYPDSWNINHFAKFACLAQDKSKTAELIARVKAEPLMAAWENPAFFEKCRSWSAAPSRNSI